MDDGKERQRQRYWKYEKKRKKREERERYRRDEAPARAGRARRATRDDEPPAFEKIRRTARGGPRGGRAMESAPRELGTVVAIDRGRVTVRLDSGAVVHARPPQLAVPDPEQTPVVGDVVEIASRRDVHRVLAVRPRRTRLARTDPARPDREKILAANVDIGCVLAPATDVRPGLVERVQLALEAGGVSTLVLLSKWDLASPRERRAALDALSFLSDEPIPTSIFGHGLDRLRDRIRGRTAVFLGHSGAGKSSLLNALDPDGRRAVSSVRERDGKGRHTTTRSELRELPDGTRVVDTPGVRAFGLRDLDEAALSDLFGEFFRPGCRHRDCRHEGDEGCAVPDAIRRGRIDAARYHRFLRLRASLSDDPRGQAR